MEPADYVIVGGGTAGCVLANRLTQDPASRVVVLEAGGKASKLEVKVPAAFPKLFKTELDWDYDTEPQSGLDGRELYWPRGKMLGGCSSINAQMWVPGRRADYDRWAELGNEGWGFDDLRLAFARARHQMRGDTALRSPNVATAAFLAGAGGVAAVSEVQPITVNQRRGRRWSAADAYLKPALGRPNLTVVTDAHATRIGFEGRRATGVDFRRAGRDEHIEAAEVLLAGGAVNSPQLLLVSGVGPASHLDEFGIGVVHDLPGVGANLQDHLSVPVIATCPQACTLVTAESPANVARFLVAGKGPMTSNVGEAYGFARSRPDLDEPDLEVIFAPVPFIEHGLVAPTEHGVTVGVVLLQPQSRGSVRLASTDPLVAPRIDPGYFTDDGGQDLAAMVAGVEVARQILGTAELKPYADGDWFPPTGTEGPEAVAGFVKQRAETLYHPAGTCAMGPDPAAAVVDAELRVHGCEGLRVVDTSVMPTLNRGHTVAPAVAIAEKAAELNASRT